MTIDPEVSDYIDIAIERERKIFNSDIDHHINTAIERERKIFRKDIEHSMALYQEKWQHEFNLALEIIRDKPGREEVREITRDELRYHGLHR